MSHAKKVLVVVALVALCGCQVTEILVHTNPPPGKSAEVVDEELVLSAAVAVAVECVYSDYDAYYSAPCPELEVRADDDTLFDIHDALLDVEPTGRGPEAGADRAVRVLVGLTEGTTTLHFDHAQGAHEIGVRVVDE